jgi:hypothetical protein
VIVIVASFFAIEPFVPQCHLGFVAAEKLATPRPRLHRPGREPGGAAQKAHRATSAADRRLRRIRATLFERIRRARRVRATRLRGFAAKQPVFGSLGEEAA